MKNGARIVLLLIGDVGMFVLAFFGMLWVAFPDSNARNENFSSHLVPFIIISLLWIFVFFLFNLYETRSTKPTIPNLKIIGLATIVSMAASVILFYTVPYFGITPKTNLVIFGIFFIILFLAWRRIFYSVTATYFKNEIVLIVSPGKDDLSINELEEYISTYPQSGFYISGIFYSLEEFLKQSNGRQIDTLIVSRNILNDSNLKTIYNSAENVMSLAYAHEEMLGKVPVDSIDEDWFLYSIRNNGKIIYESFTRLINFLISLLILVATLPFTLITAVAVGIENKGSIFYTKERVGKNGKSFKLYKFRSMVEGADKGKAWTEKNDPRITKTGRIIRRLHLDEFPQLLNVLRGEMALVGPRPEIPSFAETLEREIPHYALRHIILPGFTGWAQVKFKNARGVVEARQKFEYDLYYIKNRNIFMDFGILLKTITIFFTHD